jgi:hypothetical protein
MRAICLATIAFIALSSAAAAQTSAAAPTVAAPVKMTPEEVKTLHDRLTAIDTAMRKELTTAFAARPNPGRDPAGFAAEAVYSGAAYTATPLTEQQKLLAEEHNEILAQLKAAGEKPPVVRRPRAPRMAPQQMTR